MAKFEKQFHGDFDLVVAAIEEAGLTSISSTLEDYSNYQNGSLQVAVRVFERFSYFGGNRLSLNVTLVGEGNQLFLSVITAGGSQAVFFKVNRVGEHTFLNKFLGDLRKFW